MVRPARRRRIILHVIPQAITFGPLLVALVCGCFGHPTIHTPSLDSMAREGMKLTQELSGGSAGLLRGGKGSTWEGGMRVPCIAWWPGSITAGTVRPDLACTTDLFPTALALAGIPLPEDRVLDGVSLARMLRDGLSSPRHIVFYYRGPHLMAARFGPYKAHFITQPGYGGGSRKHSPPLLFQVEEDPSEKHDVAASRPEIVRSILEIAVQHRAALRIAPSQLEGRITKTSSPHGSESPR